MILSIPPDFATYEAVAAIQIAQALKAGFAVANVPDWNEGLNLLGVAVEFRMAVEASDVIVLKIPREIRPQDGESYAAHIAQVNGFDKLALGLPKMSACGPAPETIVVAPFAPHPALDLTRDTWKHITRVARSYGLPVTLVGDHGSRLDEASFTEAENYSWRPVPDKLGILQAARLVIGVPNAWTWIAASYGRKCVIFYPDEAPETFWWPWRSDDYTLILFEQKKIQIPVVLAALRQGVALL